ELFRSGAEKAFGPFGTQMPQPGSNGAAGSSDGGQASLFFSVLPAGWLSTSAGVTLGTTLFPTDMLRGSTGVVGAVWARARPVPASAAATDAINPVRMGSSLFTFKA